VTLAKKLMASQAQVGIFFGRQLVKAKGKKQAKSRTKKLFKQNCGIVPVLWAVVLLISQR